MKTMLRAFCSLLFSSVLLVCCTPGDAPGDTTGDTTGEKTSNVTQFNGIAMTIPYEITVGKKLSKREMAQVADIINKTFTDIDAIYNKWNPQSELSRLNALPAGVHFKLSPELRQFLEKTSFFVSLDPRFDPTIEPIQQIWQKAFAAGAYPAQTELADLVECCRWDSLIFDETGVIKKHSNTALDLGGIAKGFLVDCMIQNLSSSGFTSLFIMWGGEIRSLGQHPDQRPWRAGVAEYTHPENPVYVYDLNDEAIATSGDYQQYWHLGGKTYTHIIDTKTMQPKEITEKSIASATVVAPDCMTADALATMLLLCADLDEAKKVTERYQTQFPTAKFYIQDRDRTTCKLGDALTSPSNTSSSIAAP